MSKRKNRKRAEQFIYRNGRRIPRHEWDKYQQELNEVEEARRLARIGLVKGTPKVITPKLVRKVGQKEGE